MTQPNPEAIIAMVERADALTQQDRNARAEFLEDAASLISEGWDPGIDYNGAPARVSKRLPRVTLIVEPGETSKFQLRVIVTSSRDYDSICICFNTPEEVLAYVARVDQLLPVPAAA